MKETLKLNLVWRTWLALIASFSGILGPLTVQANKNVWIESPVSTAESDQNWTVERGVPVTFTAGTSHPPGSIWVWTGNVTRQGSGTEHPTSTAIGTWLTAGGPHTVTATYTVDPWETSYAVIVTVVDNCPCSTPLDGSEWSFVSGHFPNLKRIHTCREAAATGVYNCMAWTINDTSQWWWTQADSNQNGLISASEANTFYVLKGIASGTIAYYGNSASDIVHVAKKSGGQGSACEASSKLGSNIRMSHNLGELGGGSYGSLLGGN